MTSYDSNCDLVDAAAFLRRSGRIAILTHAKPDGDAFGSAISLLAALRALDREADACFVPPILGNLLHLRGSDLADIWSVDNEPLDAQQIVVVDTGAWSQIGPLRPFVEQRLDRTLIIDHHLSGDVPAGLRLVEGQAAATCEIIAPLLDHLLAGSKINEHTSRIINEALFVGIASDTGWFRFSNTRPQTHRLAADLLAKGVDHAELHSQLEQRERREKLALLTRALGNLQLLAGGSAAVMVLRHRDFAETGALEEETERLIDLPLQVGSIQVIVLVTERTPVNNRGGSAVTRLSFRSKPGPGAINVAELAGRFGGGGHARAAGAKVEDEIDRVLPQVIEQVEAVAGARRVAST